MMKSFTLLLILLLNSFFVFSQTDENQSGLPHEMTPEELLRKNEIGAYFVQTPPPPGEIRNIAEYETMEGVLIYYPLGLSTSLVKEFSMDTKVWTIVSGTSQQNTATNQYTSAGVNLSNCVWLHAPADSKWTRDYGPWFIHYGNYETGIIDFPYNRPRPADDSIPKVIAAQLGIPWFGMNIVHTGGNYMTLGTGTSASTDLVITENPSLSVAQIDQTVLNYLGVDSYHKVPDPNGAYIDHIDCWGKYLAPDKVLIRSVPTTHPQYNMIETTAAYFASQLSPYGTPFKIFRIYTPNDQPYTNSLILNDKVFVPIQNTLQYDTAAIHVYQQAMPGYQVFGFTGSWLSTDALHCRAIGLADRGMLEIVHSPILGLQPQLPQYVLTATITPYSGMGLYQDSVILYYKVNTGSYLALPMNSLGNNQWEAVIPYQASTSVISYYLHAADSSGRSANHPRMTFTDPHVFEIGSVGTPQYPVIQDQAIQLVSASPNPFSHSCTFKFNISKLTAVSLEIFDMQGQKIKTVIEQPLGPGLHFFCWDATGESGNRVAPGMYYGRLTAAGKSSAVKIIFQSN